MKNHIIILFLPILVNSLKIEYPENIITTDQTAVEDMFEEKKDALTDILENIKTQFDEGKSAFQEFKNLGSPICNQTRNPTEYQKCLDVYERNS